MKNFKGKNSAKCLERLAEASSRFSGHVGGQKCGYKPSMALLFFGASTLIGTNKGNSAISQEKDLSI